jgi:ribose/xylose/arabinose/galactoside ABC-type transport system permease subunit
VLGSSGIVAGAGDDYTEAVTDLGKILVWLGGVVVAAGLVLMLLGKTSLPLGRLPGDIYYRGKNTTFYFPLATSILLSVVLSLVLYVVGRFRR